MKPTLEELSRKLSEVLGTEFTGSLDEYSETYKFKHNVYNESMNFGLLMKVGTVLGTLEFDVESDRIPGQRWSEWTVEGDEVFRIYKVAVNKIGTGLPWDNVITLEKP